LDLRQLLVDHLEGKSYRALAGTKLKANRLCKSINNLLANLKSVAEVTRELNPLKYTGNYIVDAKFIPAKAYTVIKPSLVPRSRKRQKIKRGIVHISGTDYQTHDLPASLTCPLEDYWAYDLHFQNLKNLNYPLVSLTCDDKRSIRSACFKHYPLAKIQLCIRHYLEEIARKLKIRSVERTIQSLDKKLFQLGEDHFLVTRPMAQAKAVRLTNHLADLEHKYWIAQEFSELMVCLLKAKTGQEYDVHSNELKEFFETTFVLETKLRKRIIKIWKKFKTDQEYLFTSLSYPELQIPRTTNLQEGYHSHWEARLSSMRGFESEETAKNYLNALVLKRRFSILTSCKKRFKHLNGKSPLEYSSGGNPATLKDWVRFCIRKE